MTTDRTTDSTTDPTTDSTTGPCGGRPQSIGLAPGLALDAAGQDAAKYGTTNPVVQRLLARDAW